MSPVHRLRSWEQFLTLGEADLGLHMDQDGKILNTPDNLWPNPAMVEIGEDGTPLAFDLDVDITELIGYHYLISRPGASNRMESLARQNSAAIPLSEGSVVHQGPWLPGSVPEFTSRVVPPTPDIETARNSTRGFAAGTYGLAIGWSSAFGPAGVGAYVFFALPAGMYPVIPRPDNIPAGATTLDIAMTRRDGGTDTARYVRKIPIERLTSDVINVHGPWRNRGRVGANRSGVPEAKAPRNRDTGTMPSDYPTLAGRWTPHYQYWLPTLPGSTSGGTARVNKVGLRGRTIRIKGDRTRVKVAGAADDAQALSAGPQGLSNGQGASAQGQGAQAGNGATGGSSSEINQEQVSGADHPDGWENQQEIRNPQRDVQGDWDKVPNWMLDMMPGNFGGGKGDGSTVKQESSSAGGGGASGAGSGSGEPEEPEEFHYEWQESPYKEKTALYFRLPRMVRKDQRERLSGLKATCWWLHESESGVLTWYRAYDSRRGPTSYFDDTDAFDGRIECPGLPGAEDAGLTGDTGEGTPVGVNKRGRGPRVRLIAEEPPTEDTTLIEGPDPTGAPERPTIAGVQVLDAGRYSAAVVGILKGGGITKRSRAARDQNANPYIDIGPALPATPTQTIKVIPSTTVNLLKNAEGAQVNGLGEMEDWDLLHIESPTIANIRVDDGVWRIWTTSPPPNVPRAESRPMKIPDSGEQDTILTACATLGVSRRSPDASLRVMFQQLDQDRLPVKYPVGHAQAGQNVPNIILETLAAIGEVSALKRISPTDKDEQTRYLKAIITWVGTGINADGYVKDFRVYPFDADIGKVEEGVAGEPANFHPQADTPAPGGSFVAVGPAPNPQGGAGQEVPPLALATFEGLPADANYLGNFTPLGSGGRVIGAIGAIHGAAGIRLSDQDSTRALNAYLEQTVTAAVGSTIALRAIYRFTVRPTVDHIRFHHMLSPQGLNACYLRMESNGQLFLYVDPVAADPQLIPLNMTVGDGGILDAEIILIPKKAGFVTVNASKGGQQRETIFQREFNFDGRTAHVVRPGVYYGGAANNRWTVDMDQVVVTRTGDIGDRENPTQAPGFPPPVEDRPLKPNGSPRRLDSAGAKINQLRIFLNPGEGVKRVPLLEDPINVRPGVNYCMAAFGRYNVLNPLGYGALEVWLESDDPDLPRRRISQLPDMVGARRWDPAGRPREDDYCAFLVPDPPENSPGYTRASPELRINPGLYVLQEFLMAQESPAFTPAQMHVFANRDAQRRYGRATSGDGQWILPTVPDHVGNGTPGVEAGWWLSEVGVKSIQGTNPETGLEAGTIQAAFETSSDGHGWLPYADPGDRPRRLMRYSLALTSDGLIGPEVSAGGIYTRSWTPVPTLTRQDGSPFPGGAYVGSGLWLDSYPQMDPRRVGDRLAPVPLSEVVNRLSSGFTVAVMTEDAIEEISYLAMAGKLRLEVPGMDNRVAGMGLLVRCEEGITFEASGWRRVENYYGVTRHMIHAVGSTDYAEVLQSGRLQRPMGPSILLSPTPSGGVPTP